jgi:hypothetical protein
VTSAIRPVVAWNPSPGTCDRASDCGRESYTLSLGRPVAAHPGEADPEADGHGDEQGDHRVAVDRDAGQYR